MKAKRPSNVVTLFPAAWVDPEKPETLSAGASPIWDRKVDSYRRRGMPVAGCEDVLAWYCELEAQMLALQQAGQLVPAAMFAQLRIYANEFFDTPASRRVPAGAAAQNPFMRNARGS